MKNKIWVILICMLPITANAASFKGRLEWVYTIPMHVLDSTQVVEVAVDRFQKVKKGDLLIRTRQDVIKAKLELATAKVEHATLAMADSKRNLERVEELFDRGLNSQDELEKAKLVFAKFKLENAKSQAEETNAKANLEYSEFRATADSIVLDLSVRAGQIVYKSTQPIIRIAPYGKMLARVLIGPRQIKKYRVGQKAKVIIAGGKTRAAKVYRLGFEPVRIESKGAIYEMDLIFNVNNKDNLRPSEIVTAVLP